MKWVCLGGNKLLFTVFISLDNENENIYETISSIINQKIDFLAETNIFIAKAKDYFGDMSVIKEHIEKYPNNIFLLESEKNNFFSIYNTKISGLKSRYVLFLKAGEKYSENTFKEIIGFFEENLGLNILKINRNRLSAVSGLVDLNITPNLFPQDFSCMVFKSEIFKSYSFNLELKYDTEKELMLRVFKDQRTYGVLNSASLVSNRFLENDLDLFKDCLDIAWYTETLTIISNSIFNEYKKDIEKLPEFIQITLFYMLSIRFKHNLNNKNKHIFEDKGLEDFIKINKEILCKINDEILINPQKNKEYKIANHLRFALLKTKYNEEGLLKYLFAPNDLYLAFEQVVFSKLSSQKVRIDLLDFEDENLVIEFSTDGYFSSKEVTILANLNDDLLETEETYRYAHTKYFGTSVLKRNTYSIKIHKSQFLNANNIKFFYKYGNTTIPIGITAVRYTAKITSKFKTSYWNFDEYFIKFRKGNKALTVFKNSKGRALKNEILMLVRLLVKKDEGRQVLLLRLLYWLTRPYFKNKNIWMTYDKLYKGGDCGEYFYKYLCKQKDNVVPGYVINKDCNDYTRLKKEGYSPLIFGSLKQKLYFLNCKFIFITHAGTYKFNAITDKQVLFLQDLFKFSVGCIQHGLTVQQLAFEENRCHHNIKRYYCATKYEIKNLSKPIYGYKDKSALKLTGIPRYDGLVNNDKKIILITPTWRNYIAMPPVMGKARPYSHQFKETEYFKIYNQLLSDGHLIKTAKKKGYKLVYLLHPVISAQKEDYPENENIEIISALDVNYEKILTEASLMVTDYSGVQFDFAYMRKPIVYYHNKKLPPHYKEGGFFYDEMGFGPICKEQEELVNTICELIQNDCIIDEKYKNRVDDFFEYSDLNNCERIYNDAMRCQIKLEEE